ncbi:MAG TPA: chondroitinase-B domain-containing protein [Kofleriaceae bacterium]|nr:chondroitinase-B domain-containing protein [Kofleriaceae bacterium]
MRRLAAILSVTFAACGGDGGGDGGDDDAGPIDAPVAPPTCDDAATGTGPDATEPGEPTLPSPTLRHLTILWPITGDADLDATVTVRFRTADGGAWRDGMPLFRVPAGGTQGFTWDDRFAGSLFDLEPATAYEVELALSDPDGGCEVRTLTASTRPVPGPPANATTIAVDTGNFTTAIAAANPGDILSLAPGTYPTFTFLRDGTPAAPITIRAAQAGVIIDGDVRLDGRSHVHVQRLTINGKLKFNGGRGLAIMGNTITTTEDGITTKTRAEDCYIADNVVTGATVWNEAALGASGANIGEGIEVTGPGHVIEHNRVRGFRDCVSLIEDAGAVDQYAIDIVGNELAECADDGVEADFCFHDCRIVGNRLTDVFMGISSQPGLGGPSWFVKNAMYSVVLSAFKLQRSSVGDVALHNTIVKNGDGLGIYTTDVFSRQWFRNNVFIGGPGGTYNTYDNGTGAVLELRSAGEGVSLDFDGYGSTTGQFRGRLGATAFTSLAELQTTTTEVHAVEVGLSMFAASIPYPMPLTTHAAADLRPAGGGAAVDRGVALPNINDDFTGPAPDLGAYEAGAPLPAYGPR